MRETREICGVEIDLDRFGDEVSVRIGDTHLTATEVAALEIPREDWSGLLQVDDFYFDEASLAELKAWVAGASEP
jgi:hypothetical protein